MRSDRGHWTGPLAAALLAAALSLGASTARGQGLLEDFMIAVANDRVADVRSLLGRGIDPNSVDRNGDPALLTAARAGNAATVDVLLAAGARVDQRNAFGDTALMLAALGGRLAIVKRLRAAGAEIQQRGWTPLIYAATGGHDDTVLYLLAEGASIDAASPNGTTALMMAAREGRLSTMDLLIARGAEVNRRNQDGLSALDYAKRGNDPMLATRLRRAGARD